MAIAKYDLSISGTETKETQSTTKEFALQIARHYAGQGNQVRITAIGSAKGWEVRKAGRRIEVNPI